MRREALDAARQDLRARRTLTEGILLALAEKTGRCPSMEVQIPPAWLARFRALDPFRSPV
jgi:hypothetical protein